MERRKLMFAVVAVLVLGVVTFAFAQFSSQSTHRELGYYDRQTGEFTPVQSAQPASEVEAPAVAPTTGTLIVKFTITAKTPVPKNGVIGCSLYASPSGESSGFSATERGSAVATLVSGDTYTCTATINYSWLLSTPATDKINFSLVHAGVLYGYQATATNGAGTVVDVVEGRDSSQNDLPTISVPASGATTTENVSITL